MSKSQALRALVSERLAAAAEDIFVLFERTITEYERELCRSKEETRRKQQLLDSALNPRTDLACGNAHTSMSPALTLSREVTEDGWIKKEPGDQSVKQEEDQLPVHVAECSTVCVKTEESAVLGEDLSSEPHFHSGIDFSDTDKDDDWRRATFCFSTAQMEAEADGVQIRDRSIILSPQNNSASDTTAHGGHIFGAEGGAEVKKHPCSFCNKSFGTKNNLERHIRVHTGEKPYSCAVCMEAFALKSTLESHKRRHTGERPYSCSICTKTFTQKCNLEKHKRTHTGEKPHSCSTCNKTFAQKSHLFLHERLHTGERPYSCTICEKTFVRKDHLQAHIKTHIKI